jgi:hypothetical protein
MGGVGGTAPGILNLGTRRMGKARFMPRDLLPAERHSPVPTEQEAGWVPKLIWALWRKLKSLVITKESKRHSSVIHPLAQTLHQLSYPASLDRNRSFGALKTQLTAYI